MLLFLCAGLQLIFTGDFLPTHRLVPYIRKEPIHPVKNIYPMFVRADFVIVNLESPITNIGKPADKKYTFRIPETFSPYFRVWHIDAVTLANNHIMDYGVKGLKRTLIHLDGNGIKHTGAGMSQEEAMKPIILEKDGIIIGILAYSLTYPESFYAGKEKPGTVYGSYGNVLEGISSIRDSVDFLVIAFHWGQELLDTPKVYQKKLARFCIDNGADLVIGHHPHVTQGEEMYRGKLIVYSLGNFAFGTFSERGKGEMLVVDIKGDSIHYSIIPLEVRPSRTDFSPYTLKGERKYISHFIPHKPQPHPPHPLILPSETYLYPLKY